MQNWIKKGITNYLDFKSFKTNKKLVIIESDDWGSLRTKDKRSREALNAINPKVKNDPYSQYDSIASQDDLEALFSVLNSVKDRLNNPACITANVCTANPDFQKIKENNYEKFYYLPFTKSLKDYSLANNIFDVWKNGIEHNFIYPQLHGREHLHALAWLKELKAGQKELLEAFKYESWSIPYTSITNKQRRKNLQAALDRYGIEGESDFQKDWIIDSTKLFEEAFGFKALTFIPPTYKWHKTIHGTFRANGINALQGIKLQYEPAGINQNAAYRKIPHYTGQIDKKSDLLYLTRNAFFEPSLKPGRDWEDITLGAVERAFKKHQPAIIGSHRFNFVGRLDEHLRDKNLKLLEAVLKKLVLKYPDVEFTHSANLVKLISI